MILVGSTGRGMVIIHTKDMNHVGASMDGISLASHSFRNINDHNNCVFLV